jgi:hypothetical protein
MVTHLLGIKKYLERRGWLFKFNSLYFISVH